MKSLFLITALVSLAACVTPTDSSQIVPVRSEEQRIIENKMESWLAEYDVPAAAIAYIENGSLKWSSVHGEQSPGVAASEATLFNIASMTKSITAETILRLVSSGKIDLDEPMSAYWIDPDLKNDPRHELLTPEIALRHRAGFPNWRPKDNSGLTFQFEPNEKTSYSGEGYDYFARFAEKKLNQPFTELARAQVLGPLGMDQTSYIRQDWFDGRVATPQGPKGVIGDPDVRTQWSAADDVHITIDDYAKFLVSVMNNDGVTAEIAEQRLRISENVFAKGCPWGPDTCPIKGGFGMGWAVFSYEGETVVMQGGGDWGERTLGFFVPERDIGIIVFTNGANGSAIIKEVVQILYPGSDYIEFLAFQAKK